MSSVQKILDYAMTMQIGSGAAAAWGSLDDLGVGKFSSAFSGTKSHLSRHLIQAQTIFDLASLTKVLATTSLYMKWVEQGKINLDALYPGKNFTFKQLLTHSSGLTWWKPFYETLISKYGDAQVLALIPVSERKKTLYDLVLKEQAEIVSGSKIVYSDLGPLLLSHYAEKLYPGLSFDEIVTREVWSGIQDCDLHYRPVVNRIMNGLNMDTMSTSKGNGIAATEICPWRGWLQGEVHDDNCWSMGGVSGHSGVFGSLNDVVAWTRALVSGEIVSLATIEKFSRITSDSLGSRRAIGFDVPSLDGSGSTSDVFSVNGTIGHLGFTGASLWIDLDLGRFAILLTNRVHPSRNDNRIRDLRRVFHRVAFPI